METKYNTTTCGITMMHLKKVVNLDSLSGGWTFNSIGYCILRPLPPVKYLYRSGYIVNYCITEIGKVNSQSK